MKHKRQIKAAKNKIQESYRKDLRKFGVTEFAPYKSAQEFARHFERCTILKSDNLTFTSSPSSNIQTPLPDKK